MVQFLCPVDSVHCGHCPVSTLQISQGTAAHLDLDKTEDCFMNYTQPVFGLQEGLAAKLCVGHCVLVHYSTKLQTEGKRAYFAGIKVRI